MDEWRKAYDEINQKYVQNCAELNATKDAAIKACKRADEQIDLLYKKIDRLADYAANLIDDKEKKDIVLSFKGMKIG